ncbi:hypothetical protein [Dialister sp.]|uniref:hypothetical protein n=1 Tax=Dialister sp. TaxID=1955814 RepID=UPI002E81FB78|nr:hypothetical protein [Dialister sp.]MEE3453319.1 hypothetical protein [Dialister sp.]
MDVEAQEIKRQFHKGLVILAVCAVLCFIPLLFTDPSFAWENGPLEMAQNVVLFFETCLFLYFYRGAKGSRYQGLWLTTAGLFLILFGRELSWGRVFFFKEMASYGPAFYSLREIPYGFLVNWVVGALMLLTLFGLFRYVPWRAIGKEIPKPWILMILVIFMAVLSSLGDKEKILHTVFDQTIEEYAELLMYILLGIGAYWYYCWIRWLEGKSGQ